MEQKNGIPYKIQVSLHSDEVSVITQSSEFDNIHQNIGDSDIYIRDEDEESKFSDTIADSDIYIRDEDERSKSFSIRSQNSGFTTYVDFITFCKDIVNIKSSRKKNNNKKTKKSEKIYSREIGVVDNTENLKNKTNPEWTERVYKPNYLKLSSDVIKDGSLDITMDTRDTDSKESTPDLKNNRRNDFFLKKPLDHFKKAMNKFKELSPAKRRRLKKLKTSSTRNEYNRRASF